LLNSKQVEYLLIGGYAVGYYGYARATADIDIWIAINPENAQKVVDAIREFGFNVEGLTSELFLQPNKIARMGVPPFRIEVLTTISGVSFEECYAEKTVDVLDGVEVNIISLKDLKLNKRASGRLKDLNDLENLE
jgi:predicted nucleotidyltransferase